MMIGSGNVATNFAMALKDKCEIVQIFSHSLCHAQELAQRVDCAAVDDLNLLANDADVYIIAVNDDAIVSVIDNSHCNDGLWLHTSGATSIDVIDGKRRHCGVIWPMQSLSKKQIVDMSCVHLFIEGNNPSATHDLHELATSISGNVHQASSHDRLLMHLASVFASNFANHMFTLSSEILAQAGLSFDAMIPLIKTTVAKLDAMPPAESQTGPASRGDMKIIEKHLELLNGDKRYLYEMISQSIMKSRGFS